MSTCTCGGKVRPTYKECAKHYLSNYYRDNRDKIREQQNSTRPRKITARVPSIKPCSYDAAHQRVRYWRGPAKNNTCACGAPAEQWSYRGHSPHEQRGPVHKNGSHRQAAYTTVVSWSPNPNDYDALCLPCHRERDRHLAKENA